MPVIPDQAAFQNSLASLAVVTYQPGETVIADGSKTGRLLILKKGSVTIEKEGTKIAKVVEPGAAKWQLMVFPQCGVRHPAITAGNALDQPHAADVRTLESSQFHVASAANGSPVLSWDFN